MDGFARLKNAANRDSASLDHIEKLKTNSPPTPQYILWAAGRRYKDGFNRDMKTKRSLHMHPEWWCLRSGPIFDKTVVSPHNLLATSSFRGISQIFPRFFSGGRGFGVKHHLGYIYGVLQPHREPPQCDIPRFSSPIGDCFLSDQR